MINVKIDNLQLQFTTNPTVFSPKKADEGTLAMLKTAKPYFGAGAKVLDLGCGYGLVGLYAAKICGSKNVVMSDIDPKALELAAANAALNGLDPPLILESAGFKSIDEAGFDLILSNPPYHTDFSVPKEIIEKGFNRLKIGGRLFMVTKRLTWYKNKIIAVFGGVKITESSGYYVFEAQRRGAVRADKAKKK